MDNNNMEGINGAKDEKTTVRDTLYGNIDISVKTMDKVILGLFGFLIFAIVMGIIM